VGRGIPGLIVTILNAGRPRDLSHLEHFRGYHQTLYRQVEGTSVTPWSSRALDRGLHATFAAMIRHQIEGMGPAFSAGEFDSSNEKVGEIITMLAGRAERSGLGMTTREEVEELLARLVEHWQQRVKTCVGSGKNLEYWARRTPHSNEPVNPHLMRDAEEEFTDPLVWKTPNSMREVEPATHFTIWRPLK